MGGSIMEPEVNGEVGKLRAYLTLLKDVWSTFGLPTIILVVILLLWIGLIPSPMGEAKTLIEQIKVSVDKHLERDKQIIFYMKQTCITNAKLAKVDISDCVFQDN